MTDVKQLFSDLVRLEIELWDGVDTRLKAACGLPLGRMLAMQVIDRIPACRVFDVAQELSITVGAASKVVDRVEASEHCVRRPNPADRRSSIIALTPAGRSVLTAATAAFDDELQIRLGSVLPPDALEQLRRAIAALRSAQPAASAERRR